MTQTTILRPSIASRRALTAALDRLTGRRLGSSWRSVGPLRAGRPNAATLRISDSGVFAVSIEGTVAR